MCLRRFRLNSKSFTELSLFPHFKCDIYPSPYTSIYKSKQYQQNPTETIKQYFILFITNVMQNITLAPDCFTMVCKDILHMLKHKI